ncbi:hypothetical protein V1509DRAFT_631206 [Lipomyces kononenkoae]
MHFPLSKMARFSPQYLVGNEAYDSRDSTVLAASAPSNSSSAERALKVEGPICEKSRRDQEKQPTGQRTYLRSSGGMMGNNKLKKMRPVTAHLKIDSNAANSYYNRATRPETPGTATTAFSSILPSTPTTSSSHIVGGTGRNLDYAFPPFPTADAVMPNVYRLAGFDYNQSSQHPHGHPHGGHRGSASPDMPLRKDSYPRLRDNSNDIRIASDTMSETQRNLVRQHVDLVTNRGAQKSISPGPTPGNTLKVPDNGAKDSRSGRVASSTSRASPMSSSSSSTSTSSSSPSSGSNESDNTLTSGDEDGQTMDPGSSPSKVRILSQLQTTYAATALQDDVRGPKRVESVGECEAISRMSPSTPGLFSSCLAGKVTDKVKCHGCGLPIEGKSIRSVDGRVPGKWHRGCFKCKACKSSFPTGEFYVLDGMPYCARDYHLQNGTVCCVCGEGVEGECFELEEEEVGCDEESCKRISERHFRNKRVHRTCFRCWECRVPLKDEFYEMLGRYLCEVHATQTYNKVRAQLFAVAGMTSSSSLDSGSGSMARIEVQAQQRIGSITMTMI